MLEVWRIPVEPPGINPSTAAWQKIPPILAKTLGRKLEDLTFTTSARGRPSLRNAPSLDFSLAHTEKIALLAVSTNGRVGIDVEEDRRIGEPMEIGLALFGMELTRRLGLLRGTARQKMFLRLWVRAEALLKATGEGLPPSGAPLDELGLWPGTKDIIRRRGRVWSVFDRRLDKTHWAAIALEGIQTNHLHVCKLSR